MMIMQPEGEKLRMGTLTQASFQSLGDILITNWPGGANQNLDYYDFLELDGKRLLLFARSALLSDDLVGMVFPSDTPFVKARQDMDSVLDLFKDIQTKLNEDALLEQSLQLTQQPAQKPEETLPGWHHPTGWFSELNRDGRSEEEVMSREPARKSGAKNNQSNQGHQPLPSAENEDQMGAAVHKTSLTPAEKFWQPLDTLLSAGHQEDVDFGMDIENGVDQPASRIPQEGLPPESQKQKERFANSPCSEEIYLDDVLVSSVQISDFDDWLAALMKSISDLTDDPKLAETVFDTTFYLVPRLNDHYLLGELAHFLREWFPKLCAIYGWELSSLSLRPDYIKWTLVDFPECLKLDMLDIVRKRTTEKIFSTFPEMRIGNTGEDFWSPGYLVDTQNREFPTQVLIAHISRERETTKAPR